MSHSNASVASLVSDNLALINEVKSELGVLDLACGRGRNGLFLLRHHIPVTFADNNESALQEVKLASEDYPATAQTWLVDFELPGSEPLSGKQYDAILVFNYLHRPLMNSILQSVKPGGLIVYETFTVDQPRFGKPTNPDFLLRDGELPKYFPHWEILSYREGKRSDPTCAKASLVARKGGAH